MTKHDMRKGRNTGSPVSVEEHQRVRSNHCEAKKRTRMECRIDHFLGLPQLRRHQPYTPLLVRGYERLRILQGSGGNKERSTCIAA